MDVMESMKQSVIVPVVVIGDVKDAVPAAQALLAGGINVMEITLRTAAALESIRTVAKECPDMVVGAGTVLNATQAKDVVDAGAKFIVSPGFDEETVKWCIEKEINVTPGCVTPTEIMAARKLGLRVVKFFPANVYGGLNAIKNLAAPFTDMQFIPTGGVNTENIAEFTASPAIFAVGGSWVCKAADIAQGNFDKIT
ncbi:MAG TPA: 2-dehydro-3-deoxyphosphogluconate aldolase, partial [Lachnospiraceae bacterium]|nr:2-dehydro-3-deoxyphosphogluconate aldolase [Lachnospiraceae bacterium]